MCNQCYTEHLNVFLTGLYYHTVLNFCDSSTFLHMPNIKTILKDIRRQLQQFIEKHPEDIQEASLSLAKSTWGKTRFTNHINFLGKCLKFKVLPKGFKLKFHSPIKRTILQCHLTSFANKLIRSSINHFRYQQTKFSKELPSLTRRLQFLCHTRDSYFDIRQKILIYY